MDETDKIQKNFEGFNEKDFESLRKIKEINQSFWDKQKRKYSNKEKEAKELSNNLKIKIDEFKNRFNIPIFNKFELGISRTRTRNGYYKTLFWIYYFDNKRGKKDVQPQLQVSIKPETFYSEIWFENSSKNYMDKFAGFLSKKMVDYPNLFFRVFDTENKLIFQELVLEKNYPKFIEYLKDHKHKLGIATILKIDEVISLKEKIVLKCQEDLKFIYENFYKPVFELNEIKNINKEKNMLNNKNFLSENKNIILYGPPGTGKTYSTKKIALELIE